MNILKFLLAVGVLILAVFGLLALFGLLAALVKYLLIFGVVALAGLGVYKFLSKSDGPQLELSSAEMEMMKAERMLAELKSKRLTK
jgi:hypothetical protein